VVKNNKKLNKMKKVTNLVLIDASGSMQGKVEEVKGGIRSLLKEIKSDMKEDKDVKVTTIVCQFEGPRDFKVLLNTSNRSEIDLGIADNYRAGGMTALYDAIGEGFSLVKKGQDGVFVSILTDGDENSSQEYTQQAIKKMLKDAKKKKWGITFMGTTESAIKNAVSWGINSANTFQFADSGEGVEISNTTRNAARNTYYTSVLTATSSADIQVDNLIEEEDTTSK
jgi:Mg-chelatase subunit ChlD